MTGLLSLAMLPAAARDVLTGLLLRYRVVIKTSHAGMCATGHCLCVSARGKTVAQMKIVLP